MKLYMTPGACSLAPHIALNEGRLPFQAVRVDLATKKLEDGSDYLAINPKGQVPALALDSGDTLTEAAVVLQYIADQAPQTGLLPAPGSMARYHTLEWVNFVATELHKSFTPLFRPVTPENYKPVTKELIAGKFALVDRRLADTPYLAGQDYSIADIYCFVMLTWAKAMGIDLGGHAKLRAYSDRLAERAAVRDTLAAEGLA